MATKIVLYSMNYSEGLLRELPYVKYYGERSFSHLASVRDPGTRVVLITPEPPAPAVLDWHLRDLFRLDGAALDEARERLTLLSPQSRRPVPLDVLVLEDPTIMAALEEAARRPGAVLVNFAPSERTDRLARELGVPVEEGPYELSERWGQKASSKAVFRDGGVPAPRGPAAVLTTMEEVAGAVMALAGGSPPAERVVLKLNDAGWGDGLGNVVFDSKKLRDTNDLPASVESMLQGWDNIVAEVGVGGAIVEEYFATRVCSPSGQARIDREGNVQVLSTHEQYTVVDQYLGCEFPADDAVRPAMHEGLLRTGRVLAANGVRGTFGVDFIGLDDGSLLATEINLRKVGPSHAVAYAEAVAGARVDPDGHLRVAGAPVHFSHRRVYEPERLVGLTPAAAVGALARDGLAYDRVTGHGVILHILGALEPAGYVDTTCFAATRADAVALGDAARASLLQAALP